MFGNLGNLTGLLKSARELQGNMARMQEALLAQRHTGESGGGQVRATVDGRGRLVDLKIDPAAAADIELLEDLVKSAVGVASRNAEEAAKQEMSRLTGGMNLPPGVMDALGGGGRT
ncbi:MAG: Nucleoid-associated protein YbaB [Phycisphaerae bacterium]|nr:Nucleoid-associated protein YbaB [Phycisphaerae bacterium]